MFPEWHHAVPESAYFKLPETLKTFRMYSISRFVYVLHWLATRLKGRQNASTAASTPSTGCGIQLAAETKREIMKRQQQQLRLHHWIAMRPGWFSPYPGQHGRHTTVSSSVL